MTPEEIARTAIENTGSRNQALKYLRGHLAAMIKQGTRKIAIEKYKNF